ncbi:MAG: pyridoxal phosphate-dependent aminotransferase [Ignavibacteria bacterium]|nr:pyridoxal phosphate-dependent aminotransferase [Ignavibacteria bacterium]
MKIAERISKITESPTMKVAAKAKQMKSEGADVIDLSVGEPDFPTPQHIKDAGIKAINENKTIYTINSGSIEIRKAIAAKLKKDNNLDFGINEIIVSNGAKQSVYNTVLTICDKDDEVIIPAPYWVSYPEMVNMAEGKNVYVNTKLENNFKITPAELEAAITDRTVALILCNPSNPTGSAYTKKELESLAEVVLKHNFYVIADEIYEKLVYDNFEFVSFASLSEEIKKRTIVINGVSKSYSMTGWRVGYTAGSADVINGINKIQSHSTSNACSISQYATVEALNADQSEVEKMRVEFEKRRDFFHKELSSIEGIKCNKPEGAFYLFPDVSGLIGKSFGTEKIKNSYDFAMFILNEAKIAAVPGSAFGAENCIRFSYATSMKNLVEAVKRLKEVVLKLK